MTCLILALRCFLDWSIVSLNLPSWWHKTINHPPPPLILEFPVLLQGQLILQGWTKELCLTVGYATQLHVLAFILRAAPMVRASSLAFLFPKSLPWISHSEKERVQSKPPSVSDEVRCSVSTIAHTHSRVNLRDCCWLRHYWTEQVFFFRCYLSDVGFGCSARSWSRTPFPYSETIPSFLLFQDLTTTLRAFYQQKWRLWDQFVNLPWVHPPTL